MPERQFTTPLIIENGEATVLDRVPFGERSYNESWLQDLLWEHPSLLPVAEIEPVFDGLLPVAWELQTPCGLVDLLFVNSDGMITIVETKLWRNPEARRKVVAQIIDYAKDLAKWTYSDLVDAVKAATDSTEPDPTVPDGPVMSSARLELVGKCPLAFFFQRGQDIALPEELELDPARWLDPLAFGSLLHEVFEQFIRDLVAKGQVPKFPEHLPQLETILDARVEAYRRDYPPPNEHAFVTQRTELGRVVRTFLSEEDQFCAETGSKPVYLEANLGMEGYGEGSQIDTVDPIPIRLADGSQIRVRGRVDRIDQTGGGTVRSYAIWDYKTGSAWKYKEGDPFRQGRVVQPALYLAMVGHRLKKAVSAKAQVVQFGFFFPGARERGRRIKWSPDQLSDGSTVLAQLVSLICSGAFLATESADDCNYCDYKAICGDTSVVAASSQKKLIRPDNTILQPFRELRAYGET